jgi:MoaA/NifB/PqqE/SkfB family radical SAM enzyme
VEEDLRIPAEELPELSQQVARLVSAGRRSNVHLAVDPLLLDMARLARPVERRFEGRGCPLVGDFLQVSPRGRVHLCPMLTGCGTGSVRDRSMKEIWESAEARQLIDGIQKLFPLPICPHCCYREK